MSFTAVSNFVTMPVAAVSTPDMCSFTVVDSGAGGNLLINGVGETGGTVGGALDLKTFFGTNFNSGPLIQAVFRRLQQVSDLNALLRITRHCAINIVPLSSASGLLPSIASYLGQPSGVTGPFLNIAGPGAAGQWRITLQMRHSIQF